MVVVLSYEIRKGSIGFIVIESFETKPPLKKPRFQTLPVTEGSGSIFVLRPIPASCRVIVRWLLLSSLFCRSERNRFPLRKAGEWAGPRGSFPRKGKI